MARLVSCSATVVSFSHSFHGRNAPPHSKPAILHQGFKYSWRCFCLFNNSKQEQARKALEAALSDKKSQFEKWNKEVERREAISASNNASRDKSVWFNWFGSNAFWNEAQQTSLVILGLLLMFFLLTKWEILLAVIVNPLLFALRWTRNCFSCAFSYLCHICRLKGVSCRALGTGESMHKSAKEQVIKKWTMN